MRSDMHRVVIERERSNSSEPGRKWHKRVNEDHEGPSFVSSSRHGAYRPRITRELSDVIGPLKKYLHKQIGRHWDDVYSELKRAIPEGLHADHIWGHVQSEITIDCVMMQSGKIQSAPNEPRYYVRGLYVHPWTGIIEYVQPASRHRRYLDRPKKPLDFIQIAEGLEYRRIAGVWYYQEHGMITRRWKSEEKGWCEYQEPGITVKRQLSRKELRKLGLRNRLMYVLM